MSVFDSIPVERIHRPVRNLSLMPYEFPYLASVEEREDAAVARRSVSLQHALIRMVEAFGPDADERKGTEEWQVEARGALFLATRALRLSGYDPEGDT